jgi:hypothetical protein
LTNKQTIKKTLTNQPNKQEKINKTENNPLPPKKNPSQYQNSYFGVVVVVVFGHFKLYTTSQTLLTFVINIHTSEQWSFFLNIQNPISWE